MSVYPVNDATLRELHRRLPPLEGEPTYAYLRRVEEANLARVIDRAAARDPRTYRETVAEAERLRVPVLLRDPAPSVLDPSKMLRLTRAAAKDPAQYRAARARAEALGLNLVLVDDAV